MSDTKKQAREGREQFTNKIAERVSLPGAAAKVQSAHAAKFPLGCGNPKCWICK